MIVKYKVVDFAKDINQPVKKILEELAAMGSTGKKNSSPLDIRRNYPDAKQKHEELLREEMKTNAED